MARRFTDAKALLDDLLDRHEAGAESPIAYPDFAAFSSVTNTDAFLKELRFAENEGAVSLAPGKGRNRDHVAHVRLRSADALYLHLGRTPIAGVVREARERIIGGLKLDDRLTAALEEIASVWTRAKTWNALSPADADKVRKAFLLADGIVNGKHVGADYRTFSRRICGDSKTLERLEGAVVKLLGRIMDLPPDARPREALRTLGLEKFAPPLLVAGEIDLDDVEVSRLALPYIGIPPSEAGRISFRTLPAYLLTIENYASFNRHITEADPARTGVTVYVGGYPSLGTQQAMRILANKLGADVPAFHWSDIDADGVWIFRTIEKALGRRLNPHLMSPELAERYGTFESVKARLREYPQDSSIAAMAEYLSCGDAKTLEQEELDPTLPIDLANRYADETRPAAE
jgi:hypothetical protein